MSSLPQTPTLTKIHEINANFFDCLDQFPWASNLLTKLFQYHPDTFDHSLRVGFVVSRILPGPELITAALLHDIGKTTLPDEIYSKPSLDTDERKTIQSHLRAGFTILQKYDQTVAEIMVAHHEWQDGPYPRESTRQTNTILRRQQQIIALADHVDALLSPRSYKPSWPKEKVTAYLSQKFPPHDVTLAIAADLLLVENKIEVGD